MLIFDTEENLTHRSSDFPNFGNAELRVKVTTHGTYLQGQTNPSLGLQQLFLVATWKPMLISLRLVLCALEHTPPWLQSFDPEAAAWRPPHQRRTPASSSERTARCTQQATPCRHHGPPHLHLRHHDQSQDSLQALLSSGASQSQEESDRQSWWPLVCCHPGTEAHI